MVTCTVNTQALLGALRLVNKIVDAKPAIQILSHVLFTAADETVSLYATDLEVGMTATCAAKIEMAGTTVIPIEKVLALVEQFPDASMRIVATSSSLIVSCGAFTSKLQCMPADEFPVPQTRSGTPTILNGAALQQIIQRTRYAINTTTNKYILRGALLKLTPTGAAMVSTDTQRLAFATMSLASPPLESEDYIIPTKTLDLLSGNAGNELVEFQCNDQQLFFSVVNGGWMISSRMVEGTYPDYTRIIPRGNEHVVNINALDFAGLLRRARVIAELNCAVYLTFAPGVLTAQVVSTETGTADETMPITYTGPSLRLCLNGNYLLDFLEVARGQTVTLALKDAQSAVLCTDGPQHLAVIMAMRGAK